MIILNQLQGEYLWLIIPHDDFIVNKKNISELETIKAYYKEYKKTHKQLSLSNISEFKTDTKAALSNYIISLDSKSADFIIKLQQAHAAYVPADKMLFKARMDGIINIKENAYSAIIIDCSYFSPTKQNLLTEEI